MNFSRSHLHTIMAAGLAGLMAPGLASAATGGFAHTRPAAAERPILHVDDSGDTTISDAVRGPASKAQEALKNNDYQAALNYLQQANALPNKTPYETYIVNAMLAEAASHLNNDQLTEQALTAMVNSGRTPAADLPGTEQNLAILTYNKKEYPQAIQWASKAKQSMPADKNLSLILLQSYYALNDYPNSVKAARDMVNSVPGKPDQSVLQIWLNAGLQAKDMTAYDEALDKLLIYYPSKEYWERLVQRIAATPNFDDHLSLDLDRFQLEVGLLDTPGKVSELIQLALQEGHPADAKAAVDKGAAVPSATVAKIDKALASENREFATGVRQAQAASSGEGLVNIGLEYALSGRAAEGIPLIEQGIAKGNLRHPSEGQLHLGIAYYKAGQKDKAIAAFKSVQGANGAEQLAHGWMLLAEQGMPPSH